MGFNGMRGRRWELFPSKNYYNFNCDYNKRPLRTFSIWKIIIIVIMIIIRGHWELFPSKNNYYRNYDYIERPVRTFSFKNLKFWKKNLQKIIQDKKY